MLRLVATDVDGTILRRDGTVTPRTREALRAVVDAGLDLVFVTGRPPRWMDPVVAETGHLAEAICANGAVVLDLATGETRQTYLIDPGTARAAATTVRALLPRAHFAVERADGFGYEPGYQTRWRSEAQHVAPLEDLVARPIAKLLVRDETASADALLETVVPHLAGLVEVTHSNSRDCLLEISALGVSKASTLARLCAQRGIDPAHVVAFGDMPNDLPMLTWAGTGYAMSGGHPAVLAAADRIAATCDEDGVAQVLERLLAGRPDAVPRPSEVGTAAALDALAGLLGATDSGGQDDAGR